MAYTQAQIDALREAIASGTTEVSYDGKTVKYRSLAEMRSLLAEMEVEASGVRPVRQHYPRFSRGL
ncbi:MAG TPA: hypothetical protein PKD10_17250 [Paracoccaceae bacterium]|nr:hypothetical protein [Paracoccaceae bacterium]HMO72640.1 hypothetical protein [Paracoccaceae bacterium]